MDSAKALGAKVPVRIHGKEYMVPPAGLADFSSLRLHIKSQQLKTVMYATIGMDRSLAAELQRNALRDLDRYNSIGELFTAAADDYECMAVMFHSALDSVHPNTFSQREIINWFASPEVNIRDWMAQSGMSGSDDAEDPEVKEDSGNFTTPDSTQSKT